MVLSAQQQPRRVWLRRLWEEHGLPLLFYGLISLGVTWPLPRFFTSQIPGESYDAYNGLWVMWHVKEWVLGHQPLYDLPLLYYPAGATLLSHVPGPLTGFFALPFWLLGPEAAHNGAVLISFTLTGYFMYLLARALKLARPVAFFAGLLLLLAPMHLAGLRGHTTKVFLGTIPLVLLCIAKALDPATRERRAILWAAATGAALLFTMLHHSLQFIMAGMALALIGIVALWRARGGERLRVLRRLAVAAAASLLFAGPLLLATARAAYDPDLRFDFNVASFDFQPDLVEFLLPPVHSLLFGRGVADFLFGFDIGPGIETAVSVSLVVLLLTAVAVIKGGWRARLWALFSLLWIVFAMGPAVRLLNDTLFTEYQLPIILPYAFLTELPGLDFLRTPGRFMQIGYVGLAITAALGLAWLRQRWPRQATALTVAVVLLVLVENWPRSWPMMTLRPVPSFYETLAEDPELFGILDLPVTASEAVPPIMYNANYQTYQMVHGKGIPMGYISRTYGSHPLFPCLYDPPREIPDVLVDGEPSPCAFHPLYDLPRFGYRYVVVHKPQRGYVDYVPGSEGAQAAAGFVEQYLDGQAPIADDALATVYAMPAEADVTALPTALTLGQGWHDLEEANGLTWRWAESPAMLVVTSPREQLLSLELVPAALHDPQAGDGTATEGTLLVEIEGEVLHEIPVALGQRALIPLNLPAGRHTVTLRLQAGNFSPAEQGQPDPRTLSFAVEALNLTAIPAPAADG